MTSRCIRYFLVLSVSVLLLGPRLVTARESEAAVEAVYPLTHELTRSEFMDLVLRNNATIHARLSSYFTARSLYRAEAGHFEPAIVGGTEWVDRQRPNTIQIERQLTSGGVFVERNWVYTAGVEANTPLGGRMRIGAVSRTLRNNVQRQVLINLDSEYETGVDIYMEQPLLRGAGYGVTMAPRRLAGHQAEAAFQDFRRELMHTVARAEVAYWELSFAQQQLRYTTESVRMAEFLYQDSQARFEAGRGAQIDVMEAQAGLALRRSRQRSARQRLIEAVNRVGAFFGGHPQRDGIQYFAVDMPEVRRSGFSYGEAWDWAFQSNPEILVARELVEQQKLQVSVARNNRLPELNIRGSFALAGLGFNRSTSFADIEKGRFPDWAVGVELRVPVLAGIRGRNEVHAAKHRLLEAETRLREMDWQLQTELESSLHNVESSRLTVANNQERVLFRERLLQDRLSLHEAGRVETRILLEAEEELMQARLELLDSIVEHERVLLELQLLQGRLLHQRGIDVLMADLDERRRLQGRDPAVILQFLDYEEPRFEISSFREHDQ